MHKTQIYLDDVEYRYLKDLAQRSSSSMTQIIRDWVHEHFEQRKNKKQDSFWELCGIATDSASDVARNFDDYLYGVKK